MRRAKLYELVDNLDEALVDYKALSERDRKLPGVMEACMRLPRQIEERNEKMKTEMLGKSCGNHRTIFQKWAILREKTGQAVSYYAKKDHHYL